MYNTDLVESCHYIALGLAVPLSVSVITRRKYCPLSLRLSTPSESFAHTLNPVVMQR